MTALILGATSPIARALASQFAAEGRAVFVASRDEEENTRIASDLRVRYGVGVGSGFFDATDVESHHDLVAMVEDELGPISHVIVAFGDMGDQESSEQDPSRARHVIEVNYTGAVSVCEAVVESMIDRGKGCVIGISSVAGDRGRQSNYIYGSAKGAFTLYLQGLRNRCFPFGVHVMTVKLGFVDTRMTYGLETKIPVASPESAAEAIVNAAKKREDEIYYPRFWRGVMGIIKVIPESVFKRLKL